MHDAFEQVVKRKAQSGDVLLNNMTPKGILKNFKENVTSISKKRSNIIDQALKFVKWKKPISPKSLRIYITQLGLSNLLASSYPNLP